jgi:membrane protein YqaA with SNARE-associated domain
MQKVELVRLFQSRLFKQITLGLWMVFFVSSFFVAFDSKPFLKYGYAGVFVFNLFGAGTLLAAALSRQMNLFALASVTALGMTVNDSVSWFVGRNGEVIMPRSKKVERIEKTIHKYGTWALFFWSLIPFPYDLIGFIAGYLEFPYLNFVIPTFMGKFVRFILLGTGIVAIFGKINS